MLTQNFMWSALRVIHNTYFWENLQLMSWNWIQSNFKIWSKHMAALPLHSDYDPTVQSTW